jgi:acetyl esterase/lipase
MGDRVRRGVAATSDSVVFKTVGACQIRADVYGRSDGAGRPAIVWLHGGALMFGQRGMIPAAQVARYVDAGYTVVAADYRLAPESTLPEILADVQDAIAWVRREGPGRFGIDPRRLALVGHSAGGYLTLLAGCAVHPRPQALVAFYGYGDIVGPWYSEPSPFYCQQPLVSAEEAAAVVGTTPLSSSPSGVGAPDRSRFYLYCRQRGLWPRAVTGHDPAAKLASFIPYCPVRQVDADYPPTLLLHGDEDTDVPYEQSVAMADALATAGVPHRLVTVAGGPHVFDWQETADTERAFAEVLAFLARYLGPHEGDNPPS